MEYDILGKAIGAGLAAAGMIGAGIGVGNVWGSYIQAVGRNPAMQQKLFTPAILGFAVTEAIALFALVVALINQFVL